MCIESIKFAYCKYIGGRKPMARTRRRKSSRRRSEMRTVRAIVSFVLAMVVLNIVLLDAQSTAGKEPIIPREESRPITATRLGYHTKVDQTTYEAPNPEWVYLPTQLEESTAQPVPVQTSAPVFQWRYQPTDEEFLYACKLAFAEAGAENAIGQTAVIEVALNSVDYGWADNIIGEFQRPYRYSSVIDGVPQVPAYGGGYRPVTEEDLSDELKEAVRLAFLGERVTEQLLREQAEHQGLTDEAYWKGGALYFFNWNAISQKAKDARNQTAMPVRIEIGNHTFARYWK